MRCTSMSHPANVITQKAGLSLVATPPKISHTGRHWVGWHVGGGLWCPPNGTAGRERLFITSFFITLPTTVVQAYSSHKGRIGTPQSRTKHGCLVQRIEHY